MTISIKKYSPQSHKIKALVYGKPGSGKTTFAATAPNAVFASAEGGLLSIAKYAPSYVDIHSLKDLQEFLHYLKTQPHNFETVIIDSITEINEVIKAEIEKRTGRSVQKADWSEVQSKIKGIIRGFRDLDMHCLFLALENIEKDEEKISAVTPGLNGKSATDIAAFMDIVGYLYTDKATGERKILTKTHNLYPTKDRSNVFDQNEETPLDFGEWVDRVKGIQVVDEVKIADYTAPTTPAESIVAPTEKTSPQATGTTPAATTARRAPEKDASDAQIKLLSKMIGEISGPDIDGDTLLKRVRKTIKDQVEIDVGAEHSTIDQMFGMLKSSQASKLIEYLKAKSKKTSAPSDEAPAVDGDTTQK